MLSINRNYVVDKVMKDEFRIDRRAKILIIISIILFCFISVFMSLKLYNDINRIVKRQAIDSITNISELNVNSVLRAIDNSQRLLMTFADDFVHRENYNIDAALKEMKPFVKSYGYYSMGIITDDHVLHLTDGRTVNVRGNDKFEAAWSDEFTISESYLPASGGIYMVNLVAYPVYKSNRLKYLIVAAVYSKNLTEQMNISSMEDKGYNILMDTNGEVVIFPRNYENRDYNNMMEFVNNSPEIIPTKSGNRYFDYNGESYYAHFEKMGIRDWYLMTCAKKNDVFADADTIVMAVFIGLGMLWFMIGAALLMAVIFMYQAKERRKVAVFYDKLLGIANGNFFPVFFNKLSDDYRKDMFLIIFDIDNFKEFNYIYGEDNGDRLLKYIVNVFHEEMPGDYLFRYLADHFAAIVKCEDEQALSDKLDRLLEKFSNDMECGVIQPFGMSAGIRSLRDCNAFRRVVSDALLAKGRVKGNHMQYYSFYDEELRLEHIKYMEMESGFSAALRNNEFQVYYQPKYDMETGCIIGAEALVRWRMSDGKILSPGEFIPCFEASRQIIMLDEAVLEVVCRQMNEMKNDGIDVKKISVNLSRMHLRQPGILPRIEQIVKGSKVDPAELSFEMTESVLYEDSIPLSNIIEYIHTIGCRVDIDDYGVGVSGPNALASNEFDVVKLDRSLIAGIGNSKTESVIRSTINLSKALGMEILAEGVEEKRQAESLVKWGCKMAQGFYYSPPVPEDEYRQLLKMEKNNN